MRLGRWRIVPYLVLAALVLAPSVWAGQDWSGWLIVGAFAAVGLILVWQRPREVVGWILLGLSVAFSAVGTSVPGSASQVVDGHGDAGLTFYAWFSAWSASLFFGLFAALATLFPSGRFPAGRLGMIGRVAVGVPPAFSIVLAFAPAWPIAFLDGSVAEVKLPFGIAPDWPGWPVLGDLVYLGVLVPLVISIGTLVVRFRGSHGVERAQYKWLLASLTATLAAVIFAFAVIFLADADGTWMWWPAIVAYPTIPLAIGIAIRRYHLYDIDRIVSRSVSYLIVTAMLAAVFGALVIALQAALAGITQGATLAVAASTVAAFALFQPLRRRVQVIVDRRFDRSGVDAQATVNAFAERLRDELDMTTLHDSLVATTRAAMRPTSASLWLRIASTSQAAEGSAAQPQGPHP
jgi:hypothetical protein